MNVRYDGKNTKPHEWAHPRGKRGFKNYIKKTIRKIYLIQNYPM